ncbi:multidrug ABC transporter permease/ATP-binding protein [Photobacterium ganghwense]|uniref:Multidrug resistance-like ATP-binding protein MdlA n=1 Tax=Photobacterium ganghwense TaxID=320778 RepID=A0A0J1JSM6_9GAMM|nr:ABC transporter transmembrane domain-containing protein [Photobacterium ganghwense]KLV05272.1 multidrug ABC transporter ATP-binding protein [Photobacterium ganghwense]PSU07993.1 multidrug ABC transporter permease/ATP-binding protein [Photobacterium ganghwense]QSV14819.1 ATP-binding cassette domain-containing protein [Photobacterium ganghwense]
MQVFWQLRWYFRQQWRRYGGAIGILILVSLFELLPPRAIGWIVDDVVAGEMSLTVMFGWLGGLVAIWFFVYFLRIIWRVWLFGAAAEMGTVLRNRLYKHFSFHPPVFFERHKTGDLMARSTNDVNAVVMTAGEGVLTAADSLITGIAVLFVMTTMLSWELTLLALAPMPLMAIAVFFLGRQLHSRFSASQAAFSDLMDKTQESLNGVRMIRAFGLEKRQQADFAAVTDFVGDKNLGVARVDAKFDPVIQLAIGMSFFLSIAGGAYMVHHDRLSLGDLTAFTLYQGLMIWPMLAMAWLFNILERGSAAWNRLKQLFDQHPEIVSGEQQLTKQRQPLQVAISQFYWPEQKQPALADVSFTLESGKMLGLAGPIGSGKSTLLALLLRQQELTDGTIHYGDVALREANLDQWRSRFAVVSQTPFLFSRSIADNIALGRPEASMAQIRAAAEAACIDSDIMQFPEGYQTLVGEKGITLSGGQKQRIAIARALLLDAEILILDDALSAVDGKTEHRILTNLRQQRGKTVIVIAHRLTALEEADMILVLQQGRVAEQGTHSSLIKEENWYAEMYRYQKLEQAIEEA